jgi:CYTH domain-containing protein
MPASTAEKRKSGTSAVPTSKEKHGFAFTRWTASALLNNKKRNHPMEIEKKYIVCNLPENLSFYPSSELEQCYLCTRPTIRIRKKNEEYILTYKNRVDPAAGIEKLCVSEEAELPLTRESYEHLREKADGRRITKTRYYIPYRHYTIELDVFHGDYDGFIMAEVEFETEEESIAFEPPDWFGKDVSGDYHYTNSYLSVK